MNQLRPALRAYVLAVVGAGVVALAWALVTLPPVDERAAITFALLFILATIAQTRPIHVSAKVKLTADDVGTLAAAIVLGPQLALILGVSTKLAAWRWTSGPWWSRAFNASKLGFSLAAASGAYAAIAILPGDSLPLVAMVGAAVTKFLGEAAFVDIAVALQLRRRPFASWWRVNRKDLPIQVAVSALGILAAFAISLSPFAAALFVIPVLVGLFAFEEVTKMRDTTRTAIFKLADLVDNRDPYTHGHSVRVAAMAERLARRLRLSAAQVELIRTAARVHDIGKAATDDHVLLKPGPLDQDELEAMRRHSDHGADLLASLPDFWEGAELVRAHHERIDGAGYPRGLRGHEIPLEVAVIAVVDAYDAMVNDRPYRSAMPWPEARRELLAGSGCQWHERVVTAFVAMIDEEVEPAPRPALAPAAG